MKKDDMQTHSLAKQSKSNQSVDRCLSVGIPEWKGAKEQRKVDGKCDRQCDSFSSSIIEVNTDSREHRMEKLRNREEGMTEGYI